MRDRMASLSAIVQISVPLQLFLLQLASTGEHSENSIQGVRRFEGGPGKPTIIRRVNVVGHPNKERIYDQLQSLDLNTPITGNIIENILSPFLKDIENDEDGAEQKKKKPFVAKITAYQVYDGQNASEADQNGKSSAEKNKDRVFRATTERLPPMMLPLHSFRPTFFSNSFNPYMGFAFADLYRPPFVPKIGALYPWLMDSTAFYDDEKLNKIARESLFGKTSNDHENDKNEKPHKMHGQDYKTEKPHKKHDEDYKTKKFHKKHDEVYAIEKPHKKPDEFHTTEKPYKNHNEDYKTEKPQEKSDDNDATKEIYSNRIPLFVDNNQNYRSETSDKIDRGDLSKHDADSSVPITFVNDKKPATFHNSRAGKPLSRAKKPSAFVKSTRTVSEPPNEYNEQPSDYSKK